MADNTSNTPRTDAGEEKFRALRGSGYDGWIDQDSNAVPDVDQWITDHTQGQ